MKYNNFTSVCNRCYQKGYFLKEQECTRTRSFSCKACGSNENTSQEKCKGKNIMIDYSAISKQFAPYYESKKRIKVQFTYGKEKEIKSGTVGMTTGWKPVFILMLRSNSTGSSYILTDNEKIIS